MSMLHPEHRISEVESVIEVCFANYQPGLEGVCASVAGSDRTSDFAVDWRDLMTGHSYRWVEDSENGRDRETWCDKVN